MDVKPEKQGSPVFFSYMLRCADGSYYCGWTVDLQKRLAAHNNGSGARYTRSRRPVELVYSEVYDNRGDAMRRELQLRKLDHLRKREMAERFIANGGRGPGG